VVRRDRDADADARPLTLTMTAAASVVLLILCAASGDLALPRTASGWIGFAAAAAFYGCAMIAFFIAISIIGPVRASLLSYAEAVISARPWRCRARSGADADPNRRHLHRHPGPDRRDAAKSMVAWPARHL
jgi:hypothetical protein